MVDEKFYRKIKKAHKKYKKEVGLNKLCRQDFTRLLAKGKVKMDLFGNGSKKNNK